MDDGRAGWNDGVGGAAVVAASRDVIGHQGRLLAADGSPVKGSGPMTFALYGDSTGGTPKWSEGQAVSVVGVIYNLRLGEITPLPDNLFSSIGLRWRITVGADHEETIRETFLGLSRNVFATLSFCAKR